MLRDLVEFGGSPDLLIDARPHIGTDRLARILPALRARLLELGVEVRHRCTVRRLEVERGRLVALHTAAGERIATRTVILAVGHHARDTLDDLAGCGVPLEAKATAVGVRIEHAQADVDRWMFGGPRTGDLPAASYRVVLKPGGVQPRPVYSFCMCPGGGVVAAPERDGVVVTNGMSGSRRSGRFANAGLVVPVGIDDFGGSDPLAGVRYLRELEARAHEVGGGAFVAPAQRAVDLLAGRPSVDLPTTTYRPGVAPADLADVLPPAVLASLRAGLDRLERRWPGFAGERAVLIGVESRTSSPVRIPRPVDGQVEGVDGLFPAGEGAGYAGGILSSASDGVLASRRLSDRG